VGAEERGRGEEEEREMRMKKEEGKIGTCVLGAPASILSPFTPPPRSLSPETGTELLPEQG
jgi:hypothetical protein